MTTYTAVFDALPASALYSLLIAMQNLYFRLLHVLAALHHENSGRSQCKITKGEFAGNGLWRVT